jgi:hypothetical protein
MHKAKTFKPFISFLAIFALLFSGIVATVTPASAASVNGCINSGWQPNDCGGNGTAPVVIVAADLSGTVGSAITPPATPSTPAGCTPSNYKLYLASDTSFSSALTRIFGIAFSTSTGGFSGTPTAALSSTAYIILLTCSNNDLHRFSLNASVVAGSVGAAATPYLTPDSLTISGVVGTAITTSPSASFAVANMTAPVSFSIDRSLLPSGISFLDATGQFSGNPTSIGSVVIVVTASDSAATPLTATAEVTFDIVAATLTPTEAPAPDRKVTICHRTHSETNPYVRITVDYNSVNRKSGHQGHDEIFAGEHVFKAGIYKRAKDKLWGDIIPSDTSGLNRWQPLNMTALGAQIYAGTVAGCPSFNPVTYYNSLREAGVPEKQIKAELAELETEQAEANPSVKKTDVTEIKYTGSSAKALEEENDKVTICHATNATTNPYRKITVSASSITNKAGHSSHDDIYMTHHVYDASVNYPANKKDWGDIIPADPTGKNRWKALNWTTLGQQIYNGTVVGCAEQTTQEIYNALREDGLPKKDVKKDLEEQKHVDDDTQDVDGIQYNGPDPEVEKTEPKEPVVPPGKVIVDQSLSGIVWLDLNRDGLKDSDEPLMKNIVLSVVQVSSIVPASMSTTTAGMRFRAASTFKKAAVVTVNTDANGFYIFPSLGAGDWKVVTGIPADLSVTYDSQGGAEGEIITTVPVASSAFTWVGLVGENETINTKLLEKILIENPNALPIAELPAALQTKIKQIIAKQAAAKKAAAQKAAAIAAGELAETGTNQLPWMFFGLLLLAAGSISLLASRLVRQKN